MKALFKVLLFVLPALLFTQCEKGEAVVNPNDPYFTIPDHTFDSALIGGTAYEHNYSLVALIKNPSDIGTLYGLDILYKLCYDHRTRN